MGSFEQGKRKSETDPEKRLYPGFDPLNMVTEERKVKEIKNGECGA